MELDAKHIKKGIRHHFQDVLETKRHPHSIALGFSVGAFIGILPTPGFNILIGLLTVFIFKKLNKFALFFGLAVWNPFTAIPFYLLSYKLGNFLFAGLPVITIPIHIFDVVYQYTMRFVVGSLIVATAVAFVSYFIVKQLFNYHYRKQGHTKKEISEMLP